jgi:hypothetical protein
MSEANEKTTDDYSLSASGPNAVIAAPDLPYQPRDPKNYCPVIGLIACGGITQTHLTAYKAAGYNVVALCDLIEERAKKTAGRVFPRCGRLHRLPRTARAARHRGRGYRHAPAGARCLDRGRVAGQKTRAQPKAVRTRSRYGRAARGPG